MREEESSSERNWFAHWEEQLPSPEELMPLSQSLITPDLALAFDIINNNNNSNSIATPPRHHHHHHHHQQQQQQQQPPNSDLGVSHSATTPGPVDEQARTLKRPRLVWTPQLHKRFVDAVAHLGIKNAVPKTIMQLMSVDGLTRENVASHLQKYRLYLKRMQGLSSAGGGGASISAADDQLFASGPIPHHFLNGGRGGGIGPPPIPPGHGADQQAFVPFVRMAALQQHHQQQMAAAAAAVAAAQQQFYGQRQQPFDHGGFLARVQPQPLQPGLHRVGANAVGLNGAVQVQLQPVVGDDDSEESNGGGGRKVLTLFPTGDD